MMRIPTFTVLCGCTRIYRGLSLLQAVAHVGRHRSAVMMLDDAYQQLLADVLAEAEAALA